MNQASELASHYRPANLGSPELQQARVGVQIAAEYEA
jgi:hypothetical protein